MTGPLRRRVLAALAIAAPALMLTGCPHMRTLPGWRRAVVVHAPSRAGDAQTARALFEGDGWVVDVVPEGPAHRSRSSLAVYNTHKYPDMAKHLSDVIAPMNAPAADGGVPPIDLREFLAPGPGGASCVLWLE